jgi:sortase A
VWIERVLLAAGFLFGLWSLLGVAQRHFYAALPVPAPSVAAARRGELPGEGPAAATTHRSLAARAATPIRPGDWVARLEAPSVGLAATVLEGSTDDMLARAAGHIEDTAFPGEPGNIGIAGHRDTTFRAVRRLKIGDLLRLETSTGVYTYRISRTFVVAPRDVYVLDPTSRPTLTLVTCYPFTFIGHAPKRYIVRAVLAGSPVSVSVSRSGR